MPNVPVISIIDDDESVRVALASLVRSLGYAVRTFTGAGEFLQLGRVDDIACLIVDVQMPGMGGLELQELLVARNMRLPTIFITAYPERLLTGAKPEPTFLIRKPYRPDEVKAVISQALFFDVRVP